MNLRELEYFVAVAELGHFGKAAERCFVTQSTLSGQLKKLEDELGTPLFERNAQRVSLTPLGQDALPWARTSLEAARKMAELANALRDPLQGDFLLAAIPTIGPYLWPRVLGPLMTKLPALRFLLREEQTRVLVESLREGKVDAGVLALPADTQGLETVDLWNEPFVLAVPTGHELAVHTQLTSEHLDGRELLLLEEGHCLREQALDFCRLAGGRERAGFQATSLETLREMVRSGVGITLLPQGAARPQEGIELVTFVHPPVRTVGLAWRKGHAREKAVDQVGRVLAKVLRN